MTATPAALPLPASAWLLIDSAPRDKTWVWGWDEKSIHPYLVYFVDYDFSDQPYPIRPANKYTGWLNEYSDMVFPTVWMHIPCSPFLQVNPGQPEAPQG